MPSRPQGGGFRGGGQNGTRTAPQPGQTFTTPDGQTRTVPEGGFRGGQGNGQGGQGGGRFGGGDPAQFEKLRKAMEKCGVTFPQGRPGGTAPGNAPTDRTPR